MFQKAWLKTQSVFIQEIQRTCNLLVFNFPRKVPVDVVLDGWDLPKGTIVVPQISAVLADELVSEMCYFIYRYSNCAFGHRYELYVSSIGVQRSKKFSPRAFLGCQRKTPAM